MSEFYEPRARRDRRAEKRDRGFVYHKPLSKTSLICFSLALVMLLGAGCWSIIGVYVAHFTTGTYEPAVTASSVKLREPRELLEPTEEMVETVSGPLTGNPGDAVPGPALTAVDEWYTVMADESSATILTLNENFKTAIQSGTVYIDSTGTQWIPGMPLPNPGCEYIKPNVEGADPVPIRGGFRVFQDLETDLTIDLTLWDYSNWTFFCDLFCGCTIKRVNMAGVNMPYCYTPKDLFASSTIGVADLHNISLPRCEMNCVDDRSEEYGVFTNSAIGYLDLRGAKLGPMIDGLFYESSIGALNAANVDISDTVSAKDLFRNAEINSMDINGWPAINLYDITGILDGAVIGGIINRGDTATEADTKPTVPTLGDLADRAKDIWAIPEWSAFEYLHPPEPILDLSTWKSLKVDRLQATMVNSKNNVKVHWTKK